jgi:hypothetical protein
MPGTEKGSEMCGNMPHIQYWQDLPLILEFGLLALPLIVSASGFI